MSFDNTKPISFPTLFINQAILNAYRSKNGPGSKIGCIFTDIENRYLTGGFNGKPMSLDIDLESRYSIHAEMNAITHSMKNLTNIPFIAYVTRIPCDQCMKNLSQLNPRIIFYLKYKEYRNVYRLAQADNVLMIHYPSFLNDKNFKHHNIDELPIEKDDLQKFEIIKIGRRDYYFHYEDHYFTNEKINEKDIPKINKLINKYIQDNEKQEDLIKMIDEFEKFERNNNKENPPNISFSIKYFEELLNRLKIDCSDLNSKNFKYPDNHECIGRNITLKHFKKDEL